MQRLLEQQGMLSDWPAFAASWNDLAADQYLADGGRYRRRRYAVYSLTTDGTIRREAHEPHYQSRSYNALHGGIDRWFEPITEPVGAGASLQAVLRLCLAQFDAAAGRTDAGPWHVEVHQFRIEARADTPGKPTPEGAHRDGVDYVLVLMIRRDNIASGTTTIHAADGCFLGSFTLTKPFDAMLIDDARVYHGVTPVEALDTTLPAYRDVLVVTFRRAGQGATIPEAR